MDSVLVTGGAGFVGTSLAIGLKRNRAATRVVALDNLKRRGSELNLPRLREAGVEFRHGDIRNAEDLDTAGHIDLILECSAEPSVLAGYDSPPAYVTNTNLVGTIHCLDLARRSGAAMIFLSTSRVYSIAALNGLAYTEEETRFALRTDQSCPGVSERGISEAFSRDGSRTLYGTTKLCSELLLEEYAEMYGLRAVVNRCGVISGPWQMGKVDQGVVALWAARHVFGGDLNYIGFGGTGKQVRDVLHIDDLLRLVLHQIDHIDAIQGEIFNVGGGLEGSTSLVELTALCRDISGKAIDIGSEVEDRPGDVRLYITDNAYVTERTGWKPEKGIRNIVVDVVEWLEAYADSLGPILR